MSRDFRPDTNEQLGCFQANEHAIYEQVLPQSSVPISSQHPRLRDAVQLNQMFSPSSEPGQGGWHILDPDGKRVMDPKKLMRENKKEREEIRDQETNNEEVDGDLPESREDEQDNSEGGFAASNSDSLRGAFLPIDAPVDEEANDSEDE